MFPPPEDLIRTQVGSSAVFYTFSTTHTAFMVTFIMFLAMFDYRMQLFFEIVQQKGS